MYITSYETMQLSKHWRFQNEGSLNHICTNQVLVRCQGQGVSWKIQVIWDALARTLSRSHPPGLMIGWTRRRLVMWLATPESAPSLPFAAQADRRIVGLIHASTVHPDRVAVLCRSAKSLRQSRRYGALHHALRVSSCFVCEQWL
jgi:hypothetical protein